MAAITPKHETGLARATGYDPLEMMREILRFDPFREIGLASTAGEIGYVPSFDVKETRDAYVFRADLPGVKEDELDISLNGNRLTVSGVRKEEKRDEGDRYFAYERTYGSFSRSFTLPEGVDTDHCKAEMKDGVLNVVLPKVPEAKPKKIEIGGKSEKTAKA